jgi:hypothetical protein
MRDRRIDDDALPWDPLWEYILGEGDDDLGTVDTPLPRLRLLERRTKQTDSASVSSRFIEYLQPAMDSRDEASQSRRQRGHSRGVDDKSKGSIGSRSIASKSNNSIASRSIPIARSFTGRSIASRSTEVKEASSRSDGGIIDSIRSMEKKGKESKSKSNSSIASRSTTGASASRSIARRSIEKNETAIRLVGKEEETRIAMDRKHKARKSMPNSLMSSSSIASASIGRSGLSIASRSIEKKPASSRSVGKEETSSCLIENAEKAKRFSLAKKARHSDDTIDKSSPLLEQKKARRKAFWSRKKKEKESKHDSTQDTTAEGSFISKFLGIASDDDEDDEDEEEDVEPEEASANHQRNRSFWNRSKKESDVPEPASIRSFDSFATFLAPSTEGESETVKEPKTRLSRLWSRNSKGEETERDGTRGVNPLFLFMTSRSLSDNQEEFSDEEVWPSRERNTATLSKAEFASTESVINSQGSDDSSATDFSDEEVRSSMEKKTIFSSVRRGLTSLGSDDTSLALGGVSDNLSKNGYIRRNRLWGRSRRGVDSESDGKKSIYPFSLFMSGRSFSDNEEEYSDVAERPSRNTISKESSSVGKGLKWSSDNTSAALGAFVESRDSTKSGIGRITRNQESKRKVSFQDPDQSRRVAASDLS